MRTWWIKLISGLDENMKIDTRATVGMIAVMQAFEDGKVIQYRDNSGMPFEVITEGMQLWDWPDCDYRIKPQTVEEASLEYVKDVMTPECYAIKDGFKAGAKWREENLKEEL